MILLDYYFYSAYLEKDLRCAAFYHELKKPKEIVCLILPKSETLNSAIFNGKLLNYLKKSVNHLLIVPESTEFYYTVSEYQERFLKFAENELPDIFQKLLNLEDNVSVTVKRMDSTCRQVRL
ncbi:hypothetical protein [Enterococcus avium]|uniref:hypothetical protein n=1 Tax=Enterococcus avium TaxID=33945 RepID=UPI00159DB26D|nr:hypothetical protein [Enterococcus avium]NVN75897.1 hypothetical protein [Enterococcus avium]